MSKRKALHRLIKGCNAYKSLGVPAAVFDLILDLTREVYGDAGVSIIKQYESVYDGGDYYHYTLIGFDNDAIDGEIYPKDIIKKLKELKK